MSVVYNGAHSITFIEALDSDTDSTPTAYSSYKRSWRDFHLVPEKRPSVNPPSPALKLIDIPGTNRRIDMTDLMPGGLKFGRRQGEWQFILDHDLWDNWHIAKKTIEDAINGKRLYCILEDDFNTAYRGRFRVQGWQSGPNYSSIAISYDLEYKKYTNVFSIQSDEEEQKDIASWSSVDIMIRDSSYKKNINIGDTSYLKIFGEYDGLMEVAAIDEDIDPNNNKLPITWISKKSLYNGIDAKNISGGYQQWTNIHDFFDTLILKFPDRLKSMIKIASKSCYTYSGTTYYYDCKLWLPSQRELGETSGVESSGPIYSQIFKPANPKLIRLSDNENLNGIYSSWQLRTNAYRDGSYRIVRDNEGGRDPYIRNSWDSTIAKRIVFGFCTGAST